MTRQPAASTDPAADATSNARSDARSDAGSGATAGAALLLTPALSLYLDAVRFAAALAVFIAHFTMQRLDGGWLWQLNVYGHQAVTVFFVLSGFVIAHAVDTRERSGRDYAVARIARLASVVLPALLLTALLDAAGRAIRPGDYTLAWGYAHDYSLWRFFTGLTFTHQLWWLNVQQGSNVAYWSLGYEVPYYLLFGLLSFMRGRWRWPTLALALLACGPGIVLAAPLWFGGVVLKRHGARLRLGERAGLLLFAGSIAAWLAYEAWAWQHGRPLLPPDHWTKRRELLQDVVVGLCFAANLLGFAAAAPLLRRTLARAPLAVRAGAPMLARAVRWLAGATFTLYLCHLPIAQFLFAVLPWPHTDMRSRALVLAGTLGGVLLLAALTERPKQVWRRAVRTVFDGWPRRAAGATH